MIKINTHRKAKFDEISDQEKNQNRPRFISLQNGLPEKEGQALPKWIDYLEGRISKPSKAAPSINIQDLETTFDSVIGNNKIKGKKVRKPSKDHHRDVHSPFRSNVDKNISQIKDQVK